MTATWASPLGRVIAYFGQFRGFNRDVKLVLLSGCFASVVVGLSSIIQPLYLSSLGYDSAEVGALIGVSALTSVLALFPAGVIADRYGRRNILVFSMIAYALAFALLAVYSDTLPLLIASALIGVSWGTYIGPSNALLTDRSALRERTYVFSLYSFVGAFSIIAGSLLAGATSPLASALHQNIQATYRTMFWIGALIALASIPFIIIIREPPTLKHESILTIRSWRLVGSLSIVSGLMGFGAGSFIPLLPLYLHSRFIATEAQIGIVFAVSNTAIGVTNILAPRLCEDIGQVLSITLTSGLSIIPLVLMPASGTLYAMSLLYVVRTGLMNMSSPIMNAYTMSMINRDERASASGVITMAWNGANAAGTAVSGILMSIYLDSPLYVGAAFYALSTFVFYAFFRNREPSKE
jgi:MFS family permease